MLHLVHTCPGYASFPLRHLPAFSWMEVRVSLHAAKEQTCFVDSGDFWHLFTFHHLTLPLPYAIVLPTSGSAFLLAGGPEVLAEFS